MEAEDVIKRHLGRVTEIEIENEQGEKDTFKMSPLKVKDLPEIYDTLKVLEGASEDNPSAVMNNMTPPLLDKIAILGVKSLKPNYPNVSDETLRELVIRHAFLFATELWKVNLNLGAGKEIGEIKRRQAVARIKKANANR